MSCHPPVKKYRAGGEIPSKATVVAEHGVQTLKLGCLCLWGFASFGAGDTGLTGASVVVA